MSSISAQPVGFSYQAASPQHAAPFAAADKELINQMSADPRMRKLVKLPLWSAESIAMCLGVYAMLGFSIWCSFSQLLPIWATILLNAYAMYLAFFVWHEGTHQSLSSSKLLNDVLGTLGAQFLTPTMPIQVYRVLHLQHHRNTGENPADPDDLLVRAKTWQLPFVLPFIDLHWALWYVRYSSTRPTSEKMMMGFFLLTYVAWHVLWLSSPYAMDFILLWMIPQRMAFTAVAYMFARIQHPHDLVQREHPFQATVVNPDTPLYNIFLYGGNGFHLVHHIWPSIPYYRVRSAWYVMREYLNAQDIPYIERRVFDGASHYTLPPPRVMQRQMQIAAIREITPQIKQFTLRTVDGQPLPAAGAGAHVKVHLDEHCVRHYSVINPGATDAYQIAVKREEQGAGGSKRLHQLQVGDTLNIGSPNNFFPLRRNSGRAVLVAGGIGFTPILAMARHLAKTQERDYQVHLCVRSAADAPLALLDDNEACASHIQVHRDDASSGGAAVEFAGVRDSGGFDAARALGAYAAGDELYICGPAAMMKAIKARACELGWPEHALFSEQFGNPADMAERHAFNLKLARSGREVAVSAGQSALEALEQAGVTLDNVCRQGVCGACRCKVLSGPIEHRDVCLSDEEHEGGKVMTVCVSRAGKDATLVLDL